MTFLWLLLAMCVSTVICPPPRQRGGGRAGGGGFMVSMTQKECKAQGMSDAGLEKLKTNIMQIQKEQTGKPQMNAEAVDALSAKVKELNIKSGMSEADQTVCDACLTKLKNKYFGPKGAPGGKKAAGEEQTEAPAE